MHTVTCLEGQGRALAARVLPCAKIGNLRAVRGLAHGHPRQRVRRRGGDNYRRQSAGPIAYGMIRLARNCVNRSKKLSSVAW
jgi:hypothetical protein